MQNERGNLLTRGDTLLGVCEGLGEDLGFNPNYLRVLLAVGLLWNPTAVIATYLGLGVLVAATRWLVPTRRTQANAAPAQEQLVHQNDDGVTVMAEAA